MSNVERNLFGTTVETSVREELEGKYEPFFTEKLDFRRLVTYVPNKTIPIYNWFKYKEGFSRDLVYELLNLLEPPRDYWVYDPFAGVGTTLLTAKELGYKAVGVEILPSAVFCANVKLAEYDTDEVKNTLNELKSVRYKEPDEDLPDVNIIGKAFPDDVRKQIVFWRSTLFGIEDERLRDFFLLALMGILESVSYTSKDGQFLRIVEREIPSVRDVFLKKTENMIDDLGHKTLFPRELNGVAYIYEGDTTRKTLPEEYHGRIGTVITSPPYLNRYDYSRTYSLELLTFFTKTFEELREIRHNLLRSHIESKEHAGKEINEPAVDEILDSLSGKKLNNNRIPIMIRGYFEDMNEFLKHLSGYLAPGASVALVVANAQFEGEHVPTDLILSELAANWGLSTEAIWITRYKGNSSQQMRKYGRRPVRESIAFWRKDEG